MKGSTAARMTLALSALWAVPATAHDLWELGSVPTCVDDSSTTCNQLIPGVSQVHDIQGTVANPDVDWMVVETKAYRSYEVDLRAVNFPLIGPGCAGCPRVDRVNAAGSVLTSGDGIDGVHPFPTTTVRQVVSWAGGSTDQRDWIRVQGPTIQDMTANDRYELVLRDTTLAVARWNNSASQATVLLISNQAPYLVAGFVFFYDAAGVLLHAEPFSVPRFGMKIIQTSGILPLAGGSGSATIAHDGGYGGLAGKAVALEPATGYTFDTMMTYVPY